MSGEANPRAQEEKEDRKPNIAWAVPRSKVGPRPTGTAVHGKVKRKAGARVGETAGKRTAESPETERESMSGTANPPTQEEDKKPGDQAGHINLKVKGQASPST